MTKVTNHVVVTLTKQDDDTFYGAAIAEQDKLLSDVEFAGKCLQAILRFAIEKEKDND